MDTIEQINASSDVEVNNTTIEFSEGVTTITKYNNMNFEYLFEFNHDVITNIILPSTVTSSFITEWQSYGITVTQN